MKLDRIQSCEVRDFDDLIQRFIYKHTNSSDTIGKLVDNFASFLGIYATRTLVVKIEAQRIRSCIDRYKCIFKICNAADFYKHHVASASGSPVSWTISFFSSRNLVARYQTINTFIKKMAMRTRVKRS